MNFDTSVRGCVTTTLDRFDVGNVYRDDAEKLHSDLIGINAISLEDALDNAMDVATNETSAASSAASNSATDNVQKPAERSSSIDYLKQQVRLAC